MFVVQKDFQTFNQKFKAGQELKPADVDVLPAWAVDRDFIKEVPVEVVSAEFPTVVSESVRPVSDPVVAGVEPTPPFAPRRR